MADTDLQITIRAIDQASTALAGIKTQLAQVQGVAAKSGAAAGDELGKGVSGGAKVATDALRRISPELASIASAAGPAAVALSAVFVGVKLYKEAWELASAGARADDISQAYYEINGGARAAAEGLEMLREASKGTITELNLMQGVNTAKILGIDVSNEDMARLMALARERAKALGQTTDFMFDSMIRGIGRMSPLILDNLGIVIDQKRVYEEWAQSIGKAADALTEAEQKAAIVNEILKQAPADYEAVAASHAEQVAAMKAAQQDFRTELGRTLTEMLNIAPTITSVLEKTTGYLRERRQIEDLMAPYYQHAKEMDISSRVDMERQRALRYELNLLASQAEWGAITFEQLTAALAALDPVTAAAASGEAAAAASLGAYAFAAMNAESATLKLASAQAMLARMDYLSSTYNAPGGYPTGKRSAMGLPEGVMLEGIGFTPSKWSYSSPRSSARAGGIGGGGGGSASSWESDMRAQAQELRSLVESILVPTEVTFADIAASKAGTYADKWDEYGRKMRAIANDQQSVWRDMVPQDILAQGEDAIRGWAEQQEKLFYAGRMPGEINWGDFVARAKEEIANKQAREALVQEAMRQLQAAGVSMSGADVQSLMGGTPGASTGVEMAGAFGTGLVANDTAAAVTRAFQEQMAAQQSTWERVGSMCIVWFAAGLKMGITAETGRDIVVALWPFLAEMINREAPLP
jgi:hypothetical protein